MNLTLDFSGTRSGNLHSDDMVKNLTEYSDKIITYANYLL